MATKQRSFSDLVSDEGEALAEFKQKVPEVPDELAFDGSLVGIIGDGEELEVVGVLERFASQV